MLASTGRFRMASRSLTRHDRADLDHFTSTRALDTLSLSMTAHGVYTYLVTNYDNPAAITTIVW